MQAPAHVDRSTLRLSEVARHVVIPEGIVDSLWYDVVDRCEEFGDEFDAWQDGLGEAILGIREDGMFAATIGGVTMSIARQVAKTFIVGRICVALCTLFPNLTILWTAHRTRTATRTFQNLKGFVMQPSVIGYVRSGSNNGTAIRDTNGEQAIPFVTGSEILFGAREGGFGRGFDEVDVEVFDEAQILTVKALEDMIAATNQSRFVYGALLFYMGTPPRPTDPGEAFTERRNEALEAKRAVGSPDFGPVVEHGDALFIECSADANVGQPGGPSLDDPRQIEKANPSYPLWTPPVSVKRLRKNLPGDDAWRREGLGVWDGAGGFRVSSVQWEFCRDASSKIASGHRFVLDVAPNRSWASISVAGLRDDGVPHVEITSRDAVIDHRPGVDWVVSRVVELAATRPGFVLWLISGKSAESLVPDLIAAGIDLEFVKSADVPAACGLFYDYATSARLRHIGQSDLTDALAGAQKSVENGESAWRWGWRKSAADITPLYAATIALWVLMQSPDITPSVLFL